jgi:N-acetylglucosaminyl-diphospho-decaprenol L-rhamnosyltransferase
MELSIIIVNWNSLAYLRACLASVYRQIQGISFEVIVVDNASPEGGIDSLKPEFPDMVLIKSAVNLGFAGANNVGFKRSSGKYVLFLNPDTEIVGDAIQVMLEQSRLRPDAGIVGCKLLNTDRSVQLQSIQKFPTILSSVLDAEYLLLRWPHCPLWDIQPLFQENVKVIKVEVIPGACMLLKREVFEKVGMLSEDYFMYAEDLDLNYKLKRAHYNNYYVGQSAIIHHGGRSSSQQKVSQWATIMRHQAMLEYYRKTRGLVYKSMYRAAIGCTAAVRLMILTLMFPLGNIVWERKSLKASTAKWKAVLNWALGRQDVALGSR